MSTQYDPSSIFRPIGTSPANGDGCHVARDDAGRSTEGWQSFPIDALPPVMARFATELGQSLSVDPSMAALPMLSIAGAAIGNTARARMSGDYLAPANVWSAVAVRSGEKKSPVLRAVMQPIYTRQHEAAEQHAAAAGEYAEKLDTWKALPPKERRATDKPVEPPSYPHLYLSDTTTEAIAMRLSSQPRGLAVVLDELSGFFSGMNQYRSKGGNDRESYLAFYDAGAAKIDRKSATPPTIFIPRAFVGVCGMIQPGALGRAAGIAEFDTGMIARFLLSSPPPQSGRWQDHGVSDTARDGWRDLLHGLLDTPLPEHPMLIPPSDAAMRLWADAHDRLERERFVERDDRMRAARAKLIGVIPRLSLIFQCVSAASGEASASVLTIDETSMSRAIELAEWFTRETRRVYRLLEDDGSEDDVFAWIEERGGQATPRELAHRFRALRARGAAEDYLNSLEGDGIGKWGWAAQNRRGRPRRIFILHVGGNGNTNAVFDRAAANFVTVTTSNDDPLGPTVYPTAAEVAKVLGEPLPTDEKEKIA